MNLYIIIKKVSLTIAVACIVTLGVKAQNQTTALLENLHPATPTAFQFLKYSEIPVSEYTGIPDISVPLYTIQTNGITIPLTLSYHSGGIRVNQEASWIGLGWDMQIGSIIQQVNDVDDFQAVDEIGTPIVRALPDYFNTGNPTVYPRKRCYGCFGEPCEYNCNDATLSVNTPVAAFGFEIYTDSWVPVNGVYYQDANLFGNYLTWNSVDTEPDIFAANFLGHSLKFMVNWNYNVNHTGYQIMVLNKKGYQVSRDGDVWKIIVPSGEEYDFELKSVVKTSSSSDDVMGTGTTSSSYQPSSIIWMLTKIVAKNGQSVTLNYSKSAESKVYPSFTQKKVYFNQTGSLTGSIDQMLGALYGLVKPYNGFGGIPATRVYSNESAVCLSSIVFPNGRVDFSLSDRSDVRAGKKLDSMVVSNGQKIKSYKFNHSYFDASGVGGNVYSIAGYTDTLNTSTYRLKLLSLEDNSGAKYNFTYNSTPLPAKNSFAIDYWGYYNGQTSNTTFVPNPAQFTRSSGGNIDRSALGNNGDNHSANSTYAQAALLQSVQFPTGGKATFSFELNQFDNYWVPDFANSVNTMSSGNGLRVKDITFYDANNAQLKKTQYTYAGGKAIAPALYFRQYNVTQINPGVPTTGGGATDVARYFSLTDVSMNGMFSSNPFASINGVGYSQVTKTDVDASGTTNGKTVSTYYNNPDQYTTSASTYSEQAVSLPTIKNKDLPENGSIDSILVYTRGSDLIKKIKNQYVNENSPLLYGARVFGFDQMVTYNAGFQLVRQRSMVGYYPIYDFETMLTDTRITDYYGSDSVTANTHKAYDAYRRIGTESTTNSDLRTTSTSYSYLYNGTMGSDSVVNAAGTKNRLMDVASIDKTYNGTTTYQFIRTYKKPGSIVVPALDKVGGYASSAFSQYERTSYDLYDAQGNILQYQTTDANNSVIYGYANTYVITEAKNATFDAVACTSFEADGKGNWTFSGTPTTDTYVPTGKKVYGLASGTISSASLAAGTYIVSYWSKSGIQSVNSTSTATAGATCNGYTLYQHLITLASSGTIAVSGTGTIDELRLHPRDAQVTTYTYEPLIGVTSVTDARNQITYYEYDSAKRLANVKDQYGNIVKHIDYHYQNQ